MIGNPWGVGSLLPQTVLSCGPKAAPACTAFLSPAPLPLPPLAQVVVSSFEETLPKEQYSAADYARHTAAHKAMDVAGKLAAAARGGGEQPPALVIGADTVVEHGEHILEKPADAAEAARVLRMLSGQRHRVHTGVALVLPAAGGGDAAAEVGRQAGAVPDGVSKP